MTKLRDKIVVVSSSPSMTLIHHHLVKYCRWDISLSYNYIQNDSKFQILPYFSFACLWTTKFI